MWGEWRITAIIPCLNEEQGVEQVLRRMPDYVDEVIVVDNGSTDRTAEVARSYGAKVVREDVRGYGRAYKQGFAHATGDVIITLDGDHSYPVDALSYLLSAFEHLETDFLERVALPGARPQRHELQAQARQLGRCLWPLQLLFLRWVRDSQSGMWGLQTFDLREVFDSSPTACPSRRRSRWRRSSTPASASRRSR